MQHSIYSYYHVLFLVKNEFLFRKKIQNFVAVSVYTRKSGDFIYYPRSFLLVLDIDMLSHTHLMATFSNCMFVNITKT